MIAGSVFLNNIVIVRDYKLKETHLEMVWVVEQDHILGTGSQYSMMILPPISPSSLSTFYFLLPFPFLSSFSLPQLEQAMRAFSSSPHLQLPLALDSTYPTTCYDVSMFSGTASEKIHEMEGAFAWFAWGPWYVYTGIQHRYCVCLLFTGIQNRSCHPPIPCQFCLPQQTKRVSHKSM